MENDIIFDDNVIELDSEQIDNIILEGKNTNIAPSGQVIPECHQAQNKGINYYFCVFF